MPVRFGTVLLLTALTAGCEADAPDSGDAKVFRLHGEGKVGSACLAQSDCGHNQRCAYRGEDVLSKTLVVENGVCEAKVYPGGCFATLPAQRLSMAKQDEERREGRKGLPVSVMCH